MTDDDGRKTRRKNSLQQRKETKRAQQRNLLLTFHLYNTIIIRHFLLDHSRKETCISLFLIVFVKNNKKMPVVRDVLSRRIQIALLSALLLTTLFLHNIIRVDVSSQNDTQIQTIMTPETFELAAFHPPPRQYTDNRPPLDELIDPNNNTIVGSVQFLLDFSIIGFGKCGTSTMMHWLAGHEDVQSFRTEIWDLMGHRPDQLIRRLYQELPGGGNYKRGYKVRAVTRGDMFEYVEVVS